MKNIGNTIQSLTTLKPFVRSSSVGKKLDANWHEIFGMMAKDISYGYLKDKTLVVYVKNAAWVQEIQFYKKEFLEKTKKILKDQIDIQDLVIKQKKYEKEIKPTLSAEAVVFQGSLKEKIQHEVEKRKKIGYKLCNTCHQVWQKSDTCVFCKQNDE